MASDRISRIGLKQTNGEYLSELDDVRAVSNASATAISAHTILTSATVQIVAVGTSNLVKLHLWNINMRSADNASWLDVEFRDGGFLGRRLFGPVKIQPSTEMYFARADLAGRAALSSIEMVILSSQLPAAQSGSVTSGGVIANVGFMVERLDFRE